MVAAQPNVKRLLSFGGRKSGALTTYRLSLQRVDAVVKLIDPRLELTSGLACSTHSLPHSLNVPAIK